MVLLHPALAGGRRVEADDVLVAAVGEHFAVNSLRAADGFLGGGAGRGGAVQGAFERDADFVFVLGLLERGIEQDAGEDGGTQAHDCADLGFAIWHGASLIFNERKPRQRLPGPTKRNRPLQSQKQRLPSRRDAGVTKVKGAHPNVAATKATSTPERRPAKILACYFTPGLRDSSF